MFSLFSQRFEHNFSSQYSMFSMNFQCFQANIQFFLRFCNVFDKKTWISLITFNIKTRPTVLPFNCSNLRQFYGIEVGQEQIWTIIIVTLKFSLTLIEFHLMKIVTIKFILLKALKIEFADDLYSLFFSIRDRQTRTPSRRRMNWNVSPSPTVKEASSSGAMEICIQMQFRPCISRIIW